MQHNGEKGNVHNILIENLNEETTWDT